MNAGSSSSIPQRAQDHKELSNILKQQAKICASLFQALDERDALNMKIKTYMNKLHALDEHGRPIWDRIKDGDDFSPRTNALNSEALDELQRYRNATHYATLAKKNSLIFEAKEVADKQARESETSAPPLPPKRSPTSPISHSYEQSGSSRASPSTVVSHTPAEGYERDPRRQARLKRVSASIGSAQPTNETNEVTERNYPPNPSSIRMKSDPPSASHASASINVSSTLVRRYEEVSSARAHFPSIACSPTTQTSFFEHPRNSESKAATPIVEGIRRRTQSLRSGLSSLLSPAGSASKASAPQPDEAHNHASINPRRSGKYFKRI